MIRFYYGSGSPFSWRVQLVLEEKRVPYEPVLLSFERREHRSPEHMARSPHGKVPALEDDGVTLYESGAIVEYLEERFPEPPLMPRGAAGRARVRIEEIEAVDYFGSVMLGLGRRVFFTPPERRDPQAIEAVRGELRALLAKLEARATERGGQFVAGPLSRADLAWLPFVELAGRAGVDLAANETPWLVAWRNRLRARPSYERTYPPHWRSK